MTTDADTIIQTPDAYEADDGILNIRASALGSCTKRLVLAALGTQGAPPPDWLQRAFDAGNKHEGPILERLRVAKGLIAPSDDQLAELGFTFGGPRADQLELTIEVPGKVRVVCHPDAVYLDAMGGVWVVEAKALAKGTNPAKMASYQWQWAVELHGARLATHHRAGVFGFYVVGRKAVGEDGTPTGELEEDLEITPYAVDEAPYTLGAIKARALKVWKLWGEALESGLDMECDAKDYPCPMWETHDGRGVWKDETVEVRDPALAALLKMYQEAKLDVKDAEDAKKELGVQVGEAMARLSLSKGVKVACGGWTLKWVEEEVPESTITRKAYVKSYPDVREDKKASAR